MIIILLLWYSYFSSCFFFFFFFFLFVFHNVFHLVHPGVIATKIGFGGLSPKIFYKVLQILKPVMVLFKAVVESKDCKNIFLKQVYIL